MANAGKHSGSRRQQGQLEYANLIELLRYRAACHPRRTAFIFLKNGETESCRLTFGELDLRARSIAARLQQRFRVGDRVLLAYTSGVDFVAAFFGCLYAGVVAVPVAAPTGSTEVARLAATSQDTGAVGLCMGREGFNHDHLAASHLDLGQRLHCLTTTDDAGATADQWVPPAVASSSPALLQHTAGTTGAPKGVLVSHGNLLHNQHLIQQSLGHSSRTIGVSWLPLHRDMGLIGVLLQPVYLGCTSVLMSPAAFLAKPLRWLQAISRYRATTSGGPTFAYELCVRRISAEQLIGLDLGQWQTAFIGAGMVHPHTLARFAEKFGIARFRAESFVACYGSTEATLLVSSTAKRQPPKTVAVDGDELQHHRVRLATAVTRRVREITSCGKASGQQIMVVDPVTHLPCAAEGVGEVWMRGGSVTLGYANNPALTKAAFDAHLVRCGEGPFLRTGDLGFMMDGELFITGSLKDLIVIRGRHYYPQDIEDAVRDSHPLLSSGAAAAICINASKQSRRLVLMQEVQHEDLGRIPRAEVLNAARSKLRDKAGLTLHDIVFLKSGSLPRTTGGQVQREQAWVACKRAASARTYARTAA